MANQRVWMMAGHALTPKTKFVHASCLRRSCPCRFPLRHPCPCGFFSRLFSDDGSHHAQCRGRDGGGMGGDGGDVLGGARAGDTATTVYYSTTVPPG